MKIPQKHIWMGIGAATVTLVIGVALLRLGKSKKRKLVVDFTKFDSPDSIGSGQCIDRQLLVLLDRLQRKTNLPIFDWINSGVRTSYWNKKIGGVTNSSHAIPICKAVDIKAPNKAIRDLLVFAAKEVGFKRIGVGTTFVHLDIDTSKSQNVAWGYPSGNPAPVNPFV